MTVDAETWLRTRRPIWRRPARSVNCRRVVTLDTGTAPTRPAAGAGDHDCHASHRRDVRRVPPDPSSRRTGSPAMSCRTQGPSSTWFARGVRPVDTTVPGDVLTLGKPDPGDLAGLATR